MNILARDKSFYGQYKFLTSHSIFIVSSNIYRYHSYYVPSSLHRVLRPSMIFVYIYIRASTYFFIIIIIPSPIERNSKFIFPKNVRLHPAFKHLSILVRYTNTKILFKKKKEKNIDPSFLPLPFESARERKKFHEESYNALIHVKLERR